MSRRAAAIALTEREDSQRTLQQWQRLDVATLRLKCNAYNLLATGKKAEMTARLLDHFNRSSSSSSGSSSDTSTASESDSDRDDDTLPPQSDVDQALDQDEEEMRALLASDN